jgi:hypothetical protein
LTPARYRVAAALAAILWCAALVAPDDNAPGWVLAITGWLGPLGLFVANKQWSAAFEWYANVPFAGCLVWMFLGRRAPAWVALCALGLGFTVFVPICDVPMLTASAATPACPLAYRPPFIYSGLATDLWVAALTAAAIASMLPMSGKGIEAPERAAER